MSGWNVTGPMNPASRLSGDDLRKCVSAIVSKSLNLLAGDELRLLLYCVNEADASGIICKSINQMTGETGLGRRSVCLYLRSLQKGGYLETVEAESRSQPAVRRLTIVSA
jgi:hypothetical protein